MKKGIFMLVAFLWIAVGCEKEEALTATEGGEPVVGGYVLPQGNHDYDPKIVELSNKYNMLILYKFEEKDFWWNVTKDIRWEFDTVGKKTVGGYEAQSALEKYVGQQVELLETEFFTSFPDTFLTRTLPYKMLLSSEFNEIPAGLKYYPEEKDKKFLHVYSGYDYLGVNWGNEKVLTMTEKDRDAFRVEACSKFLKRLFDGGVLVYSAAFVSVTNYATKVNKDTQYEIGVIYVTGTSMSTPQLNLDWLSYVDLIVSTPYDRLVAEGGVLNAGIDTKGKVRQKYDLMVAYFKDAWNIDLQAIGNRMEK